MILLFFLLSIVIAGVVATVKSRQAAHWTAACYYGVQILFAAFVVGWGIGRTELQFFTFDLLGTIFFVLMSVISAVAYVQSNFYLDNESLRQYKLYNISLMLLCTSATGVYFANNVAVTWIFLEATTLCTAGLVYHRRNRRSLEATWKYVFVCSLGIAVAYLGILLLSTVTAGGELSYANLVRTVTSGNPLYLKIAFLFILVGYSCKMEIFPLYTIDVDANFAAPAPASAVISTVLVNAGFVAFFRVYEVAVVVQACTDPCRIDLAVDCGGLFASDQPLQAFLGLFDCRMYGCSCGGTWCGRCGYFCCRIAGHHSCLD